MAERRGNFYFQPNIARTVLGEHIPGVDIWPVEGFDGERAHFRDLGKPMSEAAAIKVATNYAAHWIDMQMNKSGIS